MQTNRWTSRAPYLALGLLVLAAGLGAALLKEPQSGVDMTKAAQMYLKTLSAEEKAQSTMAYDSPQRLEWHFIPKDERKGLQLREMNEEQQKAAHRLLASALSQIGYKKSVTIMDLEKILHKLEGDKGRWARDELRYYVTIFGEPNADGKWGLSFEGHHLSLNFVIEGGKVVSHTPAFFGANPGVVMDDYGVGPKKNTRVLKKEEVLAFKLVRSLDKEQAAKAIIAAEAPADLRSAGEAQVPDTKPEGLVAKELTPEQVENLWALLESYTENMLPEIAERRKAEIKQAGIENVYFAWSGAKKPGIGHYYRIEGPTFLVEFCNTQPDAAGNPANHIHSFWRDTKGDFALSR